eukprot:TRINITY_DN2619_c0_g2_i2.p1 TRINITY_DN2619_c0_g2~~TRINITY_DN2619_c0_g2_i2.p1  ORF type:complete len:2024 (+),score=623.63 TRINITY_DN2619_c0_g2_i2:230-6301(+)
MSEPPQPDIEATRAFLRNSGLDEELVSKTCDVLQTVLAEAAGRGFERLGHKMLKYAVSDWLYHSFNNKPVGTLAQYSRSILGSDNIRRFFCEWWPISQCIPSKSDLSDAAATFNGFILITCLAKASLNDCSRFLARNYFRKLDIRQLKGFSDAALCQMYMRVLKTLLTEEDEEGTFVTMRLQSLNTKTECRFRVPVVDDNIEQAKQVLWNEVYEKIRTENYPSSTVNVSRTDDGQYCAEVQDEDDYSATDEDETTAKLNAYRTFFKNQVPEDPVRAETGTHNAQEPRLDQRDINSIKSSLWKETKKLLRDYTMLKGLTDAEKQEALQTGWVPMSQVIDVLKEPPLLFGEKLARFGMQLTEEEVVKFMEMHDVIERLAFTDDLTKGRALYYHTGDSKVDLESGDEVFDLVQFTGTTDSELDEYMKSVGLDKVMYHGVQRIEPILGTNKNNTIGIPVKMAQRCVCVDAVGLAGHQEYHRSNEGKECVKDGIREHLELDMKDLLRRGWKLRKVKKDLTRRTSLVLIRFQDNEHMRANEKDREVHVPIPNPVVTIDNDKKTERYLSAEQLEKNRQVYLDRIAKVEQEVKERDTKVRKESVIRDVALKLREYCGLYDADERYLSIPLSKVDYERSVDDLEELMKEARCIMTKNETDTGVVLEVKQTHSLSAFAKERLFEEKEFGGYKEPDNLMHALRPGTFEFERLEFLGDAVLDLLVMSDCNEVDRLVMAKLGKELQSHSTYFVPTTENGHKTEAETGLLPITKGLLRDYEHLVTGANKLESYKKKIYGDIIEAMLGGMYLEEAIGIESVHERVRCLFRKYGVNREEDRNFYSSEAQHHACFDPERDEYLELMRNSDVLLFRPDELWQDQEEPWRRPQAVGRRKEGSNNASVEKILRGLCKVGKKENKPAWSTHFKFQGESSSYIRSYTNTEVYTRMITYADEGIIGYTNEAISLVSRLAIDLDGVSSEEIVFPQHEKYGGWTLAEVIHDLVAEMLPNHHTMTIVLDISRPNKFSQHMHWPYVCMTAAEIFTFLSTLQDRLCEMEAEYIVSTERDPAEYKKSLLQELKCMGCSQQNNPRRAETFVYDAVCPREGMLKCMICSAQNSQKKKESVTINFLSASQLKDAFYVYIKRKWVDFIDAGMFTSRKLRMYLSDKFDEDANPPRAKGYPVHQKKIYLHGAVGSKPTLLYNFQDEKPVHHIKGIPVPHIEMLKLVSLRHPTYMMSYHHNYFKPGEDECEGFWKPTPLPSCVAPQPEAKEGHVGLDSLYSSAISLCNVNSTNAGDPHVFTMSSEEEYAENKAKWEMPEEDAGSEKFCVNQMYIVTVQLQGYQRKELWQGGEQLLCLECHAKDADRKFKMEVVKLIEPVAAEDLFKSDAEGMRDLWSDPLLLPDEIKEHVKVTVRTEAAPKQPKKSKGPKNNQGAAAMWWESDTKKEQEPAVPSVPGSDVVSPPKPEAIAKPVEVVKPAASPPVQETVKPDTAPARPETVPTANPVVNQPVEETVKPETAPARQEAFASPPAQPVQEMVKPDITPAKPETVPTAPARQEAFANPPAQPVQEAVKPDTTPAKAETVPAARPVANVVRPDAPATAKPETAVAQDIGSQSVLRRKEKEKEKEKELEDDVRVIKDSRGDALSQWWEEKGKAIKGIAVEYVPKGPARLYYMLGLLTTIAKDGNDRAVLIVSEREQQVLHRLLADLGIKHRSDEFSESAEERVYIYVKNSMRKDPDDKLDSCTNLHVLVSCIDSLSDIVCKVKHREDMKTFCVLLAGYETADDIRPCFFSPSCPALLRLEDFQTPEGGYADPQRGFPPKGLYAKTQHVVEVHVVTGTETAKTRHIPNDLCLQYVNEGLRVLGWPSSEPSSFSSVADVVRTLRSSVVDRRMSMRVERLLASSMNVRWRMETNTQDMIDSLEGKHGLLVTESMSTVSGTTNMPDELRPRQITYKDLQRPPCRYFNKVIMLVNEKRHPITADEVHNIFGLLRAGGTAVFLLSNKLAPNEKVQSAAPPATLYPFLHLHTYIDQARRAMF